MTPQKFKKLTKAYGACGYVKEEGIHKAWWDAYDRDGQREMCICFGRLIELIQAKHHLALYLIGNWVYWNPKAPVPPVKTAKGRPKVRASQPTA